MREKGTEAKSVGFYIILIIDILLSLTMALLIGFEVLVVGSIEALNAALLGAEGALIGFMITIFALYFTYDMPEKLKAGLIAHGFYWQLPRDMIRCVVIFAIGITLSIISYFTASLAQSIIVGISILQLLSGLALSIYVTIRFFMIVKKKR